MEASTAFEVRPLVWDSLRDHLNPVEWQEIKDIIGKKLIEENEALQNEISVLLDMWQEFRGRTERLQSDLELKVKSSTTRSLLSSPAKLLLENKIKMLLQDLKKENLESRIPVDSPREHKILEYLESNKEESIPQRPLSANRSRSASFPSSPPMSPIASRSSRPSTPLSIPNTPSRPTTPLSIPNALSRPNTPLLNSKTSLSTSSSNLLPPLQSSNSATALIASGSLKEGKDVPLDTRRRPASASPRIPIHEINKYLNVYQIKKVKDVLVKALEEEHQLLLEDVEYLQKCLDDEWMYSLNASKYFKEVDSAPKESSAPSLQELREFAHKLEKSVIEGVQSESSVTKSPSRKKLPALQTHVP